GTLFGVSYCISDCLLYNTKYTALSDFYYLSLHDALPISISVISKHRPCREAFLRKAFLPARRIAESACREGRSQERRVAVARQVDRKSTRLNSSHVKISYAVYCLKKKNLRKHPVYAKKLL